MEHVNNILAVDIGSGTQDILIVNQEEHMENNPKMVVPSQTQIIGSRIEEYTRQGKDIFLSGYLMGGGASKRAVKNHINSGYQVYAAPEAALTFKDDLEKVQDMGVKLTEKQPPHTCEIKLRDIDISMIKQAVTPFNITFPQKYAFCVQDHGYSPVESNRLFRFRYWQEFLEQGGHLSDLAYLKGEVPDYFTRMSAVQKASGGDDVLVMDTGGAALLGALQDKRVKQEADHRGALVVNVGNQHTIAFLVYRNQVYGVFEHHTNKLTFHMLYSYLSRFKQGKLTNQEVYQDLGHGSKISEGALNFSWDFTAVTGPRRSLLKDYGYLAMPYGDMMLVGAYGLEQAYRFKCNK